jgi:hypothetical protein
MFRSVAWAAAAIAAVALSACATQPHSDAAMLSGTHSMPNKAGVMADSAMPSRSVDCMESALATMPPEHRQACEAAQARSH